MNEAELPACQDRPRCNTAKMGDRDAVGQDLGHSNTTVKTSKCEAGFPGAGTAPNTKRPISHSSFTLIPPGWAPKGNPCAAFLRCRDNSRDAWQGDGPDRLTVPVPGWSAGTANLASARPCCAGGALSIPASGLSATCPRPSRGDKARARGHPGPLTLLLGQILMCFSVGRENTLSWPEGYRDSA